MTDREFLLRVLSEGGNGTERPFLCRLGLHRFSVGLGYVSGYGGRFRCSRCPQTAVWDD